MARSPKRQRISKRRAAYPFRPTLGCNLCNLPHTDPFLIGLWEIWRNDRPVDRRRATLGLLNEMFTPDYSPDRVRPGTELTITRPTIGEIEQHVSSHLAPQPSPDPASVRRQLPEIESSMSARQREVVRFIAQAQLATSSQLRELFYADLGSEMTRRKCAEKELRRLAHRHLIYRTRLQGRRAPDGGCEVLGLGLAGALALELNSPQEASWPYVTGPDQAFEAPKLDHDLGVNEIFLQLRRSTTGPLELDGRRVQASLLAANYWAARQVGVSLRIPYQLDGRGRPRKVRSRTVWPDALAAAGVRAGRPSFLLPFLIEHDRGGRKVHGPVGVAEQLYSHIHVALAGVLGKRFPELDVEGYAVPVLFSTSEYRVKALREKVRELLDERGFSELRSAPIFLVQAGHLAEHGLAAPVMPLLEGKQDRALLQALAGASKPLIKAGGLTAETVLQIDPAGAQATHGAGELSAHERAAERGDAAASASELDTYEREANRELLVGGRA